MIHQVRQMVNLKNELIERPLKLGIEDELKELRMLIDELLEV